MVQPFLQGDELTVGYVHGHVGTPIRILRPEGKIYSFARENIVSARKERLEGHAIIDRVRETVTTIAGLLGVNWGVRMDFILERKSGRMFFLECDAVPLIHAASAFSWSLELASIQREKQLDLLLKRP